MHQQAQLILYRLRNFQPINVTPAKQVLCMLTRLDVKNSSRCCGNDLCNGDSVDAGRLHSVLSTLFLVLYDTSTYRYNVNYFGTAR